MKYSKRIVEHIVSLVEKDTYSISEICNIVGISRRIFYKWKEDKPDFKEMLLQATEVRDESLVSEARKSLRKKIRGFKTEEIKTTYIVHNNDEGNTEMKIKEQVVNEKYYAPDTSAITFVLTNKDSQNWRNKQSTELTGTDKEPIMISVTNLETKMELEKLQKEAS